MIFLLKLFPEITIKSAPVRKRWTKRLADNLRILARRIDPEASVRQDWDRLILRLRNPDPNIDAKVQAMLKDTPGIANFARVRASSCKDLNEVLQLALEVWRDALKDKTFCVRVKRSGVHDFTSLQAEQFVGAGLLDASASAGVRLKNPDCTVHIEIKDDECLVVEEKHSGLGGFPLGTQESVLSLVSGGFDSTVASYLMMRRGLRTHFCFFNLGGQQHELAVKEIAFYLWNRFGSSHRVRFISVPFEAVVADILKNVAPANMGVVLKRQMLRAANAIAERGRFDALVTGEAVAQVSSQTLPNLSAIDAVSRRLVLRPLIAMDKPDIIELARRIGTESFSANVPEYCGVISVRPSSKVKLAAVEAEEALLDPAVLDASLSAARVELIDEVASGLEQKIQQVDVVGAVKNGQVVIDIRHPQEAERGSPHLRGHEVLTIPFYTLNSAFAQLDASRHYLLYCDKGVMSQLHAAHLLDQGFRNVGVFRPQS